MVGKFILYPVGMTTSKKNKYQYTFLTGILEKPGQLLNKCESVSHWTDDKHNFEFMKPVNAIVDAQGDFTQVLEILS